MFCLSDGTPLVGLNDEVEQQTVIRSTSADRVVKPDDSSGSIFKYISVALASLLVLVLIGGIGAVWILWPRPPVANIPPKNDLLSNASSPVPTSTRDVYTSNENLNSNRIDLNTKEKELELERRRLADERKKLEDDKRPETETVTPDRPRYVDPGTARINFRRGSVGETVSGTVGRSRSYVLRTLPGQYLSASIRSAGGCVIFSGGSSNTGFTTGGGDARLTVQNTCDQPSNFSLSVTVR